MPSIKSSQLPGKKDCHAYIIEIEYERITTILEAIKAIQDSTGADAGSSWTRNYHR